MGMNIGTSTHTTLFAQTIPPLKLLTYLIKTAMLIDERTINQVEHPRLFIEAANEIKFIGS
jgi:hypothetical protein